MEQPEAGADLVGRTSARLLAAGVDRRERLDALHLLAILDASVDTTGRVRRPLDDLAGEFELAPLSVLRSVDHLEHVGALERDGAGVVLLGARPEGLGGMQLAGFLDDVRASFAGSTPVARRSGWIARSGAALVAAAAAIAVLTLAPGQSTIEPPLALGGAGTTAVEQTEASTASELDAPITRVRPRTRIVAPTSARALDTAVTAAAHEEQCDPTSSVPDRVDCVIDEDLIADLGEGVLEDSPVVPEETAPPATHELVPAAPGGSAPTIPDGAAPAATILDLVPATDQTEGVSRTVRA